MYIAQLYAIK